jgi:alpha-L-fucosidase
MKVSLTGLLLILQLILISAAPAQDMKEHPDLQWFRDAKFGIFVHWGLYSQLAGEWKGKHYYGSGEWLMYQGQIPASEYAAASREFNPVNFNAADWVNLVRNAGARYLVVTAKHHEGFAMFNSKFSDFNIVKASSYGKDPMKALADAAHKANLPFGFYYSQFLDWHEPDGGGNAWDFKGEKKYQKYYAEKSIPQLKELMTQYGRLGMIWFDMPGGLTKEETRQLVDSLHRLQPQCLFSSRVGQGLGDYTDFGDSETPPTPVKNAWEAIYTFNDSWGYIRHDLNFKPPTEIIRLIAQASSRGGNLMLNIGPDGKGNIPPVCIDFLKATGKWLHVNGESIYGTTFGFVPAQPWGVTTSKPGKLYLHVFTRPADNELLVPGVSPKVTRVTTLSGNKPLTWTQHGKDIRIQLPAQSSEGPEKADEVFVMAYNGNQIPDYDSTLALTVSPSYSVNELPAIGARLHGNASVSNLTFSHYFGDWKHVTCIDNLVLPADSVGFNIRITKPGYYKILLEYACTMENSGQEGVVRVNGQDYFFQTLGTTQQYSGSSPVMFIKHDIGILKVMASGEYDLSLCPTEKGKELFKLRKVLLEPVMTEPHNANVCVKH